MLRQLFVAASLTGVIVTTAFASKGDLEVTQEITRITRLSNGKQEQRLGTALSLASYELTGRFKRRGWENKDGLWYFYDENGSSCSGWIQDKGQWYFLEKGVYATGWKEIGSLDGGWNWYYFEPSGVMLSACRTPDGYEVNEYGVWDKKPVNVYANPFEWDKPKDGAIGQISGLVIAGMPAEFYMLSIAGETSGLANADAFINGDCGKAYGICQFDYRYELVGFMRYAYQRHPELWTGFLEFTAGYENGDPRLQNNQKIGSTFLYAMDANYQVAISDQLEYVRKRYWDGFAAAMDRGGYNLSNRHIAVSAALLSVNVNCGSQAGIFISELSPDMTDEEMIRGIYQIRNTILAEQSVGYRKKGTTTRYRQSEPQMALDLLYGYMTIDSNVRYGGGVEWHNNPFTQVRTTVALPGNIKFEAFQEVTVCAATASDAQPPQIATASQAELQIQEETLAYE